MNSVTEFQINGETIPELMSFSVTRFARNLSMNYNGNGLMMPDQVVRKNKIVIYVAEAMWSSSVISSMMGDVFFNVQYKSPFNSSMENGVFFIREMTLETSRYDGNLIVYKPSRIEMEER
ncbi:MAG: hypothetical protein LBN40_05680 [Oscillospiraceae bacterium]|jgi:hypothetical protein|nr:hypothetical protein [Oscillospiraceae bacterium]